MTSTLGGGVWQGQAGSGFVCWPCSGRTPGVNDSTGKEWGFCTTYAHLQLCGMRRILVGLRETGKVARLTRGHTVIYNHTPALSCDPTVSLSKIGIGTIGSAGSFNPPLQGGLVGVRS